MSSALAYEQPRFLRRTRLQSNEYNKNFRMIDEETLAVLTSPEADAVTPLMSKVYLRLIQAPAHCCRRERELHFEGEIREEKRVKAWDQLCQHLRVSSETAQKALMWMHEQGIIGYSAFKNGVGIFIFINRAASSVGVRAASGEEKILQFPPASESKRLVSPSAAAFNEPFGYSEVLDKDLNPHAPKTGADNTEVGQISSAPAHVPNNSQMNMVQGKAVDGERIDSGMPPVDDIIRRLQDVLEPRLKNVAIQAAQREHERTREWLDKHGIPKATRVAQREAYSVLRSNGLLDGSAKRVRADLNVGRASDTYAIPKVQPRTSEEITEMAEMCVALLETQGKSVEDTLSEISAESGGWLLLEDVPHVFEAAHRLMTKDAKRAESDVRATSNS